MNTEWTHLTPPGDDHVATLELCRPPNNFFSVGMIDAIASTLEHLDQDDDCRAVLLCAQGKHFCAGADFAAPSTGSTRDLYEAAVRIFRTTKPIVASVQGAAIGGGLGLALAADFRIAGPKSRFSANFARLGFHHGFGLTVTLPRLVGQQHAARLLYTGARFDGEHAREIGLVDDYVAVGDPRDEALMLAREISMSAPLAVESIRATLRAGLADEVERAAAHEADEQGRLVQTADFAEGTRSVAERRIGDFRRR